MSIRNLYPYIIIGYILGVMFFGTAIGICRMAYPPNIYVAVKQNDNGTVAVWADYPVLYNGTVTKVLILNGTPYSVESQLENIKLLVRGKLAVPVDIQPSVLDSQYIGEITSKPDIVYKIEVKYYDVPT